MIKLMRAAIAMIASTMTSIPPAIACPILRNLGVGRAGTGHGNAAGSTPAWQLRLIHKFRVNCFQRSCPLNPPMLGDFEFRSPPKLGGIKGGQCSIVQSFQDVYKRQRMAEKHERASPGDASFPVKCAYQRRRSGSFSFSNNVMLWYHGIFASTSCKIAASGQASAKDFIYPKLRAEKPFISGNSCLRSLDNRVITFVPHPSVCCRARISGSVAKTNSGYGNPSSLSISKRRCQRFGG
jgi:hypothetical protein